MAASKSKSSVPYDRLLLDKKNEAVQLAFDCVQAGLEGQVEELVKKGVALDQKVKKKGMSAVHLMAKEGELSMLVKMVERKVPQLLSVFKKQDFSFEKKFREAKTMKSVIGKHLDFLWMNKTKQGWRPLHLAIQEGHKEVVQLLLLAHVHGTLPTTTAGGKEIKRVGKISPVHVAAQSGCVECLELLWTWCSVMRAEEPSDTMYAPFEGQDEKGWNALHYAASRGRVDAIRWLLKKSGHCKLSLEARSNKGHTPLLTSVMYKKVEACKALISAGADLQVVANDGMTALHIAALNDDDKIARLILESNEDCKKTQDKNGDTPLHIAKKKNSSLVAQNLSRFQDLLEMKNKDGYTPATIPAEDIEFIPNEIKKRGKKAISIYKDALSHGEIELPRVKLVVLGESYHGKTTLLRRLEKLPFEPDIDRTEGIECGALVTPKTLDQNCEAFVTTKTLDEKWSPQEQSQTVGPIASLLQDRLKDQLPPGRASEEQHKNITAVEAERKIQQLFSQREAAVLPPQTTHRSHKRALPHPRKEVHDMEPVDQPTNRQPPTDEISVAPDGPKVSAEKGRPKPHSRPDQKDVPAPKKQNVDSSEPLLPLLPISQPPSKPQGVALSPTRKVGMEIQRALSQPSPEFQFTSYDFAGQELYRPMHHCFVTQRSIFLIVYNSREFPGEEKDAADMVHINYWLNTVNAYTEPISEIDKKPPVFLVGTHRGPYKPEDKKEQEFEEVSQERKKDIDSKEKKKQGFDEMAPERRKVISSKLSKSIKCYEDHFLYSDQSHFVESSMEKDESSGIKGLKDAVVETARTLPYLKDKYPVHWIRLQMELEERRGKLLSMTEVQQLSRLPEDNLKLALQFFHDTGIITYPPEIPKILLPDPEDKRRLNDVILCGPQLLADKMKQILELKKANLNGGESRNLNKHIITRRTLIDKVFKTEDEEYVDLICLFLRAYGLLFPIACQEQGSQEEAGDRNACFFAPCRMTKSDDDPTGPTMRRFVSLEVDFKGYLPDELFIRFVCMAASESTSHLHTPAKYHLNSHFCNFESWESPGSKSHWEIWRAGSTMTVAVRPPHRASRDEVAAMLSELVLLAVNKLDQLCKDLGLNSLVYDKGKRMQCAFCKRFTFWVLSQCKKKVLSQCKKKGTHVLDCPCGNSKCLDEAMKEQFSTPSLDREPTERELRKLVVAETHVYWKKICTFLDISLDYIMKAKVENDGDVEEAYFQCLATWRRGKWCKEGEPSAVHWSTLLKVLRNDAELPAIADYIEEKLLSSE